MDDGAAERSVVVGGGPPRDREGDERASLGAPGPPAAAAADVDALPSAYPPTRTPARYRPWVVRLLERHPGALLTGLYLALTAIGIAYDFLYFRRFGVNILDYAETGDFLLAALRAPLAIFYCVLPVVAIWLAALLRRWVRRVSPRYDAYAARYERKWRVGPLWWDVTNTGLVVLYAFAFTAYYAKATARAAKRPSAPPVRVELESDVAAGGAAATVATAVGTTGKFLFLYYPARDSTRVVPFDNVLQIAVQARPERRRRTRLSALLERLVGVTPRR